MSETLSQKRAAAVGARWSRTPASQAAIDKIVALAPRLTEEQRAQLRAVLAPAASATQGQADKR